MAESVFLAILVSWAGSRAVCVAALPVAASAVSDRADTAIHGGVKFLLTQQNAVGAIGDPALGPKYQTATTSLAVLALLAAGHQPTEKTPEGVALRRAIAFLLRADRQDSAGYFGAADNSTMHGHEVTTLALCELIQLGVEPEHDDLLRRKATLALNVIVNSQSARKLDSRDIGGWRYKPLANDSDLSVTFWQLLALRAGEKAGYTVSPATRNSALNYLLATFYRNPNLFSYDVIPPLQPEPTNAPPKSAKGPGASASSGGGSPKIGASKASGGPSPGGAPKAFSMSGSMVGG